MRHCLPFRHIRNSDLAIVGGKNASLGELLSELEPLGVKIPDGFAVTAQAWREFVADNGLAEPLTKGSVVASDAFFPFADGLLSAVEAGATAVIQPGGSMRDDEVIAAANEHGIAMVFTGTRHFRH